MADVVHIVEGHVAAPVIAPRGDVLRDELGDALVQEGELGRRLVAPHRAARSGGRGDFRCQRGEQAVEGGLLGQAGSWAGVDEDGGRHRLVAAPGLNELCVACEKNG